MPRPRPRPRPLSTDSRTQAQLQSSHMARMQRLAGPRPWPCPSEESHLVLNSHPAKAVVSCLRT